MSANKDKAKQAAKRAERRRRQRDDAPAPATGPTLGEAIAQLGLLAKTSHATRSVIARADEFIHTAARTQLSVVSCDDCAATKACCTLRTLAWAYEGVPIAHRLRAEGRDTPALREALRASAVLMETRTAAQYRRPCVFLGPDERCTIYTDRPAVCGTTFVASEPTRCGVPGATVRKHMQPFTPAAAAAEQLFEQELGLDVDGPRLGPLPRVVLTCLEAWDRRDFAAYLTAQLAAHTTRGDGVDLSAL